jgi:hypothetical protein
LKDFLFHTTDKQPSSGSTTPSKPGTLPLSNPTKVSSPTPPNRPGALPNGKAQPPPRPAAPPVGIIREDQFDDAVVVSSPGCAGLSLPDKFHCEQSELASLFPSSKPSRPHRISDLDAITPLVIELSSGSDGDSDPNTDRSASLGSQGRLALLPTRRQHSNSSPAASKDERAEWIAQRALKAPRVSMC